MNDPAAVRRLAALLVVAALGACSGNGSHPVPAVPGSGALAPPASSGSSSQIAYGQADLAGATYVGPAKLGSVGVDVHVALRDQDGLLQYAHQASDPGSPLYRQWLTPAQLGDRFGAPKADYDATAAALVAAGIAVQTYPQRAMLRIRGPQAAVERMLGTSFGLYRRGSQQILAPRSAPHPALQARVVALGGAVALPQLRRNFVPARPSNASVLGLAPQQIANVFDYSGAYAAGFRGAGITIGVIGTGPITDGYPGSSGGDVADYRQLFGVTGAGTVAQVFSTDQNVSPGNPNVQNGQYSKGLQTPPPVTAPNSSGCVAQGYNGSSSFQPTDYTTCNPEDMEAQLDTEQTAALAPDANIRFYLAYNPNECFSSSPCTASNPGSPQEGLLLSDDEVQQAIADNRADLVSLSFSQPETGTNAAEGFLYDSNGTGFGPTEYAMLNAEGIAVFVASGDEGAQGCSPSNAEIVSSLCVGYPATDPSATSIGGTNTPVDQTGRLTGPLTGWGFTTGGGIQASGGGCSASFPLPSYESGIPGQQCRKRSQPDLSLNGDPNTGVTVVLNAPFGRSIAQLGGTSAATPEFAAMWALVLQACKQNPGPCGVGGGPNAYRLGNPNPLLYRIYTSGSKGETYANVFYDVLYGTNALVGGTATAPPSSAPGGAASPAASPSPDQGYSAGQGYDLVTGLGAPYARHLIRAVAGV